jgi:hypothetical protein
MTAAKPLAHYGAIVRARSRAASLAPSYTTYQHPTSTALRRVERNASVRDAPARAIDDDRQDGGASLTTLL